MKKRVLENVNACGAEIIVFDIDGTLINLVGEHQETLITLIKENYEHKKLRCKLMLLIDKVAMWFVKTGAFPTNARKQKILTIIYAIILNDSIKTFRERYSKEFAKRVIFFEETKQLLKELLETKTIYFVTKNNKHFNLNEPLMNSQNIICVNGKRKLDVYKELFEQNNLKKEKALIIGDNFLHDIMSAKKLGVKCMLVDNYNSKIKQFIAKMLNVGI